MQEHLKNTKRMSEGEAVLQGREDILAPPEKSGNVLKREFGDQVSLVTLANAGHALLPEQPELIKGVVLSFLKQRNMARNQK